MSPTEGDIHPLLYEVLWQHNIDKLYGDSPSIWGWWSRKPKLLLIWLEDICKYNVHSKKKKTTKNYIMSVCFLDQFKFKLRDQSFSKTLLVSNVYRATWEWPFTLSSAAGGHDLLWCETAFDTSVIMFVSFRLRLLFFVGNTKTD